MEPIETKSAMQTRTALQRLIRKQEPDIIRVDKGKEFEGEFATLCAEKSITVYSAHTEMKSCFADRYIRTLNSILLKYLHENNTSR